VTNATGMDLDENLTLLRFGNGQLLDDELGALGFADCDLACLRNGHGGAMGELSSLKEVEDRVAFVAGGAASEGLISPHGGYPNPFHDDSKRGQVVL
jgi:hypothetical protein